MEVCIMGVDPGCASGAIAFYFPSHPHLITVDDVPTVDGEVNGAEIAERIRQMAPTVAIIEAVHAMPKQGVASTFKFGAAYGHVLGVLGAMRVPHHRVTPGKWKKHFGLSADKEEARALAIRLWPSCDRFARKKDHGRAEAALLCRYLAEKGLA